MRPTPRGRCSTTSIAATGTTSFCASSAFRAPCCPEVRDSAGDFGTTDACALRRAAPDPRRRRRPAGGVGRPGLFHAGHDEVDLRHRLLRAPQHRRRRGRIEEPSPHHHRLPARRRDDLCARRRDLRRRRGGAMAARRAVADRRGGGDRRARARRRPGAGRRSWCRPSSASARRIGTRDARARSSG